MKTRRKKGKRIPLRGQNRPRSEKGQETKEQMLANRSQSRFRLDEMSGVVAVPRAQSRTERRRVTLSVRQSERLRRQFTRDQHWVRRTWTPYAIGLIAILELLLGLTSGVQAVLITVVAASLLLLLPRAETALRQRLEMMGRRKETRK